ncbi:hypothetical protein [Actinorugispora endophytica]|uniref:Uncharacterized protein n=1 Tax=Actinorugispora endophytica TaxID=1605990 RepID=A0A4R6UBX1_9ACTN|nr:hypothetical protein [Actinorugispora endophytica]TDQ44170.1 hypothetical protein EV190_1377 [Actinorugispora endophytica]
MSEPPRPDPVLDPDLPAQDRALLRADPDALIPARAPTPAEPEAVWRFPLARWLLEHPVAASVTTVVVLLAGARLLSRVLLLVLPVLAAVFVVALLATARRDKEPPARAAARRHHGRYVTAADLDDDAARLLARAQRAATAVRAARVVRSGHIDAVDNTVVLEHQLWETATTLRRISDLRARAVPTPDASDDIAELLARRRRVLEAARESAAARVTALEDYAERVAEAERTLERATALHRLLAEQEELTDLLAATAADEHAVRHLAELTERAATAQEGLRRAAREAGEAARRLPGTG